jgi:hypothetical protein
MLVPLLSALSGPTAFRFHSGAPPGLRRAELVAFGVLHDPPAPGRSLVDIADAGCPELFQPGHQFVEAAGFAVDVDVQAVLPGLALGHVLEQQPPAAPTPLVWSNESSGWRIAA